MGHILGLDDAYPITNKDGKVKTDRCTENSETCYKEENYGNSYVYYSLMKCDYSYDIKIRANDIEMMLRAYSLTENGIPFKEHQNYKSFQYVIDGETVKFPISDVIENATDSLLIK